MEPCKHKTVEPSCPKCMKDLFEYELRMIVVDEALSHLGPNWCLSMKAPVLKHYLQSYIAQREPELKEQY